MGVGDREHVPVSSQTKDDAQSSLLLQLERHAPAEQPVYDAQLVTTSAVWAVVVRSRHDAPDTQTPLAMSQRVPRGQGRGRPRRSALAALVPSVVVAAQWLPFDGTGERPSTHWGASVAGGTLVL